MKKKITFFCFIVLIYCLNAKSVNAAFKNISCQTESNLTNLQFTIPEYELVQIRAEGEIYNQIEIGSEGEYAQPGYPDLPCYSALVAVPDQGRITFEVLSSEKSILEGVKIYPRQSLQSESELPERDFIIDEEIYNSLETYPEDAATCSEPVIMRDYRLVRVTFHPFQYDPSHNKLIVNEKINIRVRATEQTGVNELSSDQLPSSAFTSLYEHNIINYHAVKREGEFQKPCVLYIYYAHDTVEEYLEYLLNWRREQGFEVHAVPTSETGISASGIHSYIQTAYDEWENPPEYVCLVGDGNGAYTINCFYEDTGETDNNFVMLAGNDILPDAAIGRLPFSSPNELATIINKILHYEKEPYLEDPTWLNRGLMVGDPSTSGTTCVDSKRYVVEMMSQTAPEVEPIEVYSGDFAGSIASNINSGCVYFNYRGFGDFSGWTTYAIDALTNGWKLPVVVFLTCGTGGYAGWSDCMSERFIKAGTQNNPKGGVAAISTSTSMTHTTFNNCMDTGIWSGLFVNESWDMGTALCAGKLNIYNTFPTNPANHQSQFIAWNNLMGDPAMEVWSDIPQDLIVTIPEEINPSVGLMEVVVTSSSLPVGSAWVSALDSADNSVSVYTEESGSAWLPLSELQAGEIKITVTKHNYIPWQDTFLLNAEEGYVSMTMEVIDSSGNGNGLAEPGEELELEITLENMSDSNLSNLSLSATSPTQGLEFTINSFDIEELAAGEELTCNSHLILALPEGITGLQQMMIDLHLADSNDVWSSRLTEDIYAPCLLLSDFDLATDFAPGDDAELVVYLLNAGTNTAGNVNIELTSSDNRLNIVDSTAFCGMIPPGSTGNNISSPFQVIAETEIIPGTQIELVLLVSTPELEHPPLSFLITIGESGEGDPLGPDGGGYLCYDQTDTNYPDCPDYNWIEIAPSHGGSGTELSLYDNGNTGDIAHVDLPIEFNFYGETYDELSICSNGWISPGFTENIDFMNGPLPAPGGPNPMIAPFWDDLVTSYGSVCYYYDEETHTFVVEWSEMQIDYSSSSVTFEVILYDADFYPTSTGNSDLLFQYNEFNNNDQGSYGGFYVYHGQFATVGIENQNSTQGLQYTYNNSYAEQASPLADNTAIFFTSSPIPHDEAYLVFFQNEIIDSGNDGQLDYGETATVKFSLSNIGEEEAHDITVTAEIEDEYVSLISDTVAYPDISGGAYLFPQEGFELEISPDCPDNHPINFALTINYNDVSTEYTRILTAYAPYLNSDYVFVINDDNGNNIADPGESFQIGISIANQGGAPVINPQFSLISLNEYLYVEQPFNQLHSIPAGVSSYLVCPASLSGTATPGDILNLELSIAGEYEFESELLYVLNTGEAIEDFESGDFSRFPWYSGGAADFVISNLSCTGDYSAQSGYIGNSQYTWLALDIDSPLDGEISFSLKCSTENGWDYVRFYIDDIEQQSWSGEVDWYAYDYYLPAGEHEICWRYTKDAVYAGGSDCFWLDDVHFPSVSGAAPQVILPDQVNYEFELTNLETAVDDLTLFNLSETLAQFEIRLSGDETDWLDLEFENGFIPPADSIQLAITCLPQGLESGEYYLDICISDNFGDDNIISVHLIYTQNPSQENDLPTVTNFMGNYPNPFNPSTTFKFQLAGAQQVNLDIYNIRGQKVRSLVREKLEAGAHNIVWNGKDDQGHQLSSSIYFIKFDCPDISICSKILLVK